ncbi:MAG: sugar ABC transporter permease [Chloroflexota bacterium]
MTTQMDAYSGSASPPAPPSTPWAIYANIVWNVLVIAGSVWLSVYIFRLQEFGRLGDPVQYFIGAVALIPAVVAAYGSVMLWMRKPAGRYASMGLNYVGLVLSIVTMLSLWGLWDSFEHITDGILRFGWVTLGFAAAYGISWLAGRAPEGSSMGATLQNVALAVGGLTLVVILWFSGILDGISHALGTYTQLSTWLATIAAVVFGVLAWQMLNLDYYFGESPFEREAWQGWLMLSPNIIGFTIFFAGPLLLSFYLSFTDSSVGQVPNVIAFQNYAEILSLQIVPVAGAENAQGALGFEFDVLREFSWFGTEYVLGAKDTLFWRSLGNTIAFCLMLVPLSTIPAIILALILNSDLPGMPFFRAVYFLPSVAAVVGTALIWRWLYDPTIGFINYTIDNLTGWMVTAGLIEETPNIFWLTDPGVVLIAIVLLASWQLVGFNTVLFLAGLQGIPKTLYEAAQIDGANAWRRFWNVTLPLLAPTTFFVVITTVIQGLQVFNEPYTLFPSRPIPINATTSVYYLYQRGFFQFQFGYASAVAWLLFLVIFVITFIQFRVQNADND